jgi:hypothetical protein
MQHITLGAFAISICQSVIDINEPHDIENKIPKLIIQILKASRQAKLIILLIMLRFQKLSAIQFLVRHLMLIDSTRLNS